MEKIQDGEFQAIQFYLKNTDSDRWADKQEVNHNLNLSNILTEANTRIIEGKKVETLEKREQFLLKNNDSSQDN